MLLIRMGLGEVWTVVELDNEEGDLRLRGTEAIYFASEEHIVSDV